MRIFADSLAYLKVFAPGIGIEDDLQFELNKAGLGNPIISGCAWVDATVINNGRTISQHGSERLVLGYHRPKLEENDRFSSNIAQEALDSLCNMLHLGGVTPEPAENIDAARWRKVLW